MKAKKQIVVVIVCRWDGEVLPKADLSLKPLGERPGKSIALKFDPKWQEYRAYEVAPGDYLLRVEAEGYETQEREVRVVPAGLQERFILGQPGMPYYYRGKVKVPFEPRPDLLGVSVKPDPTGKEEEALLSLTRELKLEPVEVGEPVRRDHVRVFRFSPGAKEGERQRVQKRLAGHPVVRLAGPVVRLEKESVSFLTNELIVRFKDRVSPEEIPALVKRYRLKAARTIPYAGNAFLLQGDPQAGYGLLQICEELVQKGLVEYAEPNLVTTAVDDFTPNDFLFGQQPHHPIVNTEGAWDITLGDKDIRIAVVDTGCDIDHTDLINDPALGWDKIYSPYDFAGMDTDPTADTHGMKSCGIAAAIADNNEGVAGVAPGCRLMPIRRPSPGTDMQYSDAYIWIAGFDPQSTTPGFPAAISPGADILSNSFGISQPALPGIMKDTFDFLTTYGRHGRGCVVLFSVGNDNLDFTTYRQWAAYEKTIAVASSVISPPDAAEIKVSTSNFGDALDVCAPGGGPAGGPETRTLSTTNVGAGDTAGSPGAATNDYEDFGQTSCACPQVAGVAALILSANPELTWVQVRQILRETAVRIDAANADPVGQWVDTDGDGVADYSQWYGYGRINAQAAVQAAHDLVGADPLTHIDTWIKENDADVGTVPSLPPYSPDVWVRNLAPVLDDPAHVTEHQPPIRGQDNWVYANVRNRGALDSLDVYVRLMITRWAGTQYIYPDDFLPTVPPSTILAVMAPGTYLIGEVHVPSIPAGDMVTVNTVWPAALIPPETVTIDGVVYSWADSCLLVEVSPQDGPTPTGNHTWDNNNLCQRNITIKDPGDEDDFTLAFVVGHRQNPVDLVYLRVERQPLPPAVKLFVDYVDKVTTRKMLGLLKDGKIPRRLETCDLTILKETLAEIRYGEKGITAPVTLAPQTRLHLLCCPPPPRAEALRLTPAKLEKGTVFGLPTQNRAYAPLLRSPGAYQVVALRGTGLKKLKKGNYQINVYQEDAAGRLEGGINFLIRKK